ncbi:MAG: hypothetical protein ACPGJE_01100 [Wenzhouxiangellaceae bacterium]
MKNQNLAATFDSSIPTGQAAWQSWSAMQNWVMVWLWYLNVLYWVGFFYLSHAEAKWALISYAAIGPIVTVMIIKQRGLTRLSGLIHIPWLIFTVYLGLRLYSDALGPALTAADGGAFYAAWLHVVFWSTLICVVLDIIDVGRWFAGERYVLGTPAAQAAGASKLAPAFASAPA